MNANDPHLVSYPAMKTKLTTKEMSALLPHIKSVLKTGKPWEDEKLHYPAGAIIDAVLTVKGVSKSDQGFDTNGWQYDWWQKLEHGGKAYTLSGSGFYGGHSFHIADE